MSSTTRAWRRSARRATGHNPLTGCACPPDSAQARGTSAAARAACRRTTKSPGRNGESAAALATHSISGRWAAAQSSAARMPARGPANPGTSSGTTGRPVVREARRIAVGVEDQPVALRAQALDDALQNGAPGDRPQRLVAAAHAARQAAREQHAESRRALRRHRVDRLTGRGVTLSTTPTTGRR